MMTDNESDYNYCLSNISMPDIVKFGFTGDHPITRAEDLFTTGVPTPFTIDFVVELPKGFGRDFEKKFTNVYHIVVLIKVESFSNQRQRKLKI